MLCLQDWPRASWGFSEWLWRREQRTTEHTERPLTGSPPQSFTFMPPMLVATELVRALLCFCGNAPLANSTPPRPSCSLVQPQIANMKLDITAGRLTKTIRATPWTSHTSTFSPVFLSSSTLFNYAFTESIYTTTQARIRRIIPRAGGAPFFITSSWIT